MIENTCTSALNSRSSEPGAGSGAHLVDLVVEVRRGPLHLVAMPVLERPAETLEADDVGELTGGAEQAGAVAADRIGTRSCTGRPTWAP